MTTSASTLRNRIFLEALDVDPDHQEAWVQRACAGDTKLIADVLSLLREDGRNQSDDLLRGFEPKEEPVPHAIGAYRVNALLGEGGMGFVYDAVHEPTGRRAAVKLMRSGLVSPRALARFQVESESLARLDHEGIARMYDAGFERVEFAEAALDRPFIAMEFVEGKPIAEHAARLGLGRRAILELMERVARAVQHAHQRGVIHRDLKPTNILVSHEGAPKIIDFGIARLGLWRSGADSAGATIAGQVFGSLRYMSPEQARGQNNAVDTRTDVYALGAILYELLAGRPMHEVTAWPSAEALARIQTEPARLASIRRDMRGDIDAVVHRAVELDPRRRYASAGDLADDLRNLQDDAPVSARAPTITERAWRLAKKHRVAAASLTIGGAALVMGLGIASWQAVRLAQESAQKSRAIDEADAAVNYISEMLTSVTAAELGHDVRMIDVLQRASSRIRRLDERPLVQAEVRYALAEAYHSLGRLEEAKSISYASLQTREKQLGPLHLRTAESRLQFGKICDMLGQRVIGGVHLQQAHQWFLKNRGPTDPRTLDARLVLSSSLANEDRYQEALDLAEASVGLAIEGYGPFAPETLRHVAWLIDLTWSKLGDCERGLTLVREYHPRVAAERGELDHVALRMELGLGAMLLMSGNAQESIDLLEELQPRYWRARGDDHSEMAALRRTLARAYLQVGRLSDAENLLRHHISISARVNGERDRRTIAARALLALTLVADPTPDRLHEASVLAGENVDRFDQPWMRWRGRDNALSWLALGRVVEAQGCLDEAIEHYERALRSAMDHPPVEHPETAELMLNLADAIYRHGECVEQAATLVRSAVDICRSKTGPASPTTLQAIDLMQRIGKTVNEVNAGKNRDAFGMR